MSVAASMLVIGMMMESLENNAPHVTSSKKGNMPNTTPTEYEEACVLAEYLELMLKTGKIEAYTHLAQETYTKSWVTKMKNKKMGVRPGVPDYIVCTPSKLVFIELKRQKGNKPTGYQRKWVSELNNYEGVTAKVCYGAQEAINYLQEEL